MIMKKEIMDGNKACANIAYNFTEVAGIYPITPSSSMAELTDEWSNAGRENFFGDQVRVVEMQSEAGAIGAVHGMLQNGTLASTYTSSQGLLLMLPNMYKIAGEQLPCVINVAARTVATHALSIMGDHSDIYATRGTGFAILCSSSVQEVSDLTSVSYLSALKGKVPFINCFDGFRTSHEYSKIEIIDEKDIKKLIDKDALKEFRNKSLDIDNPVTRGTNQGDEIYFQAVESRNKFYDELPYIVNSYMNEINKLVGKNYAPFNYYGSKKATSIIVAMGSVCETIKETIDYLGKDIGLIEVHLYRPFSSEYFLNILPKTVKKIAVLDRTKEPGANGEPLYLDVCEMIKSNNLNIKVIGGRYGLSSKDTNPNDIEAVYNYLKEPDCKKFTLGIIDDVTNLSLEKTDTIFVSKQDEILIYGYGSDGMVTTSKDILTIVGEKTSKYVQGYFEYDSKKSGGVTISHLRFSDEPIRSSYYIKNPYMVICSKDSYIKKYDMLKNIKKNGIFLLNTNATNLEDILTKEIISIMQSKRISFYTIDASKIANDNNIPNKISMIMEAAIFKLTNLIEYEEAYNEIKHRIVKNFIKKGQSVINSNQKAIEDATINLEKIKLTSLKSKFNLEKVEDTIFSKLEHKQGELIKVSEFNKKEDGTFEAGLSRLEKRGISDKIPSYDKSKCLMCNLCSLVCPHAVIRPYLLDEKEMTGAPVEVLEDLKEAKIKDQDLGFTIGCSPLDCTGCSLCANICPSKALKMESIEDNLDQDLIKYEYLNKKVSPKEVLDKNTIKGSQFRQPSFEFHGACAGCGEASYLKLLTQLFDNVVIANATGCSSIYGASVPNTPYTVPWVNSLFEDNAEFGFGIRVAEDHMKEKIRKIMKENLSSLNKHNKELVNKYLKNYSANIANEVYNDLDYHIKNI